MALPVHVHVPHKLSLEVSQKLLVNVLGKLGCAACLSGFDIRFVESIGDPAPKIFTATRDGELQEARGG
jgi:hypothetical protein